MIDEPVDGAWYQAPSVSRILPNASTEASAPRGTRQVASYSCTMSGPLRGVAASRARSTTGVSTQPTSGNHARRLAGTRDSRRRNPIRQPRPFRHAARDDGQADQFHRFLRRRAEPVGPFVFLAEQRRESAAGHRHRAAAPRFRSTGRRIAASARTAERLPLRRKPVARQAIRARRDQLIQHRRDLRRIGLRPAACAGCASHDARHPRPAGQRR